MCPFIEQAPEMVKKFNTLFNQGNYSSIVTGLRSKDSTFHGPIVRHTLGVLFYNYQIVDSLMLDACESEIRKMVENGNIKSADSLMDILENNTRFCFPSKVISRKQKIRNILNQKETDSHENLNENSRRSGTSDDLSPSFWCLYSNTFYEEDEKPWKNKRNLFYLQPQKEHYGYEQVNFCRC